MAYETGATSSVQDLIQNKLATFAQSLGWSVQSCTSGLNFSIGGQYYGMFWDTTNLYMRAATGYSGAAAYNAQPGASSNDCRVNFVQTPPFLAYHFFGTNQYLHAAVEISSGLFRHFFIGELQKAGAYTGGFYCSGVYWSTSTTYANFPDSSYHDYAFDRANGNINASTTLCSLRADIDGKTNNWMRISASTSNGNLCRGGVRDSSFSHSIVGAGVTNFSQVTPLSTIHLFVERPSSFLSYAGSVRDLRFINMQNYAPGDIINIGSDQWMILPVCQKTETWGTAGSATLSSGNYGWAYKVIP